MFFADLELAQRLESAETECSASCAAASIRSDPACAGFVERAGGGAALCFAPGSPLNKCVGMGLDGQVPEADLDRIESLFRPRGGRVLIDLCPLADPQFIQLLAARGYTASEFENVLAMSLEDWRPSADAHGAAVQVRLARPDEALLWSRTLGRGFAEGADIPEDIVRLGTTIFNAPGGCAYFALVDGQVAGGGGMSIHKRTAALYGTAVLPEFRGRGVQTALLRTRLRDAIAAGCDLAKVVTRPGTTSQRNAERTGFRVVYTKPQMVRQLAPVGV